MTRRKDDKKKVFDEACREEIRKAISETAKRAGENPDIRLEKSMRLGAVAIIERTAYIMGNDSLSDLDKEDPVKSSLVAMVDIFDQETINDALLHCFKVTNSGRVKKATDNGAVVITEEDKETFRNKLYYISFWVNCLFLEKRKESKNWVTMFMPESEDGGDK